MEPNSILPLWLENAPAWKFWGVILLISILPLTSLITSLSKNSEQRIRNSRESTKSIDDRYKELIERGDLTYDSLVEAFKFLTKNYQNSQYELEKIRKEHDEYIDRLERDRDNGWNLGRGMEKKCHFFWHAYSNLVQEYNMLYLWSKKLIDNVISIEKFSAIIASTSEKTSLNPPPDLIAVEPTLPKDAKS